MQSLRKHLPIVAGLMAALWVFAFLMSLINGCAGNANLSEPTATQVVVSTTADGHAHHHHNHPSSSQKVVCASVCKAESTLSFSKTLSLDGWSSLSPVPAVLFMAMFALALHSPIRRFAYRSRPVKPPAALLFLRLNN